MNMKGSTKTLFGHTPTCFGHIMEPQEIYDTKTHTLAVDAESHSKLICMTSRLYLHSLSPNLITISNGELYRHKFVVPDWARNIIAEERSKYTITVDLNKVIPIGINHLKYVMYNGNNTSLSKSEICKDVLIYAADDIELLDQIFHFIGCRQVIVSIGLINTTNIQYYELAVILFNRVLDFIISKQFQTAIKSEKLIERIKTLAIDLMNPTEFCQHNQNIVDTIEEKMKLAKIWR